MVLFFDSLISKLAQGAEKRQRAYEVAKSKHRVKFPLCNSLLAVDDSTGNFEFECTRKGHDKEVVTEEELK